MLTIKVESNIQDVIKSLLDLGQVQQQATVRTLNELAAQARTRAAREIRRAGCAIPMARIKASLEVKKATSGKLTAALEATGKPIPLIAFDARQVREGVTAKVFGARRLYKGAFIATMPTGHIGVYIRAPGGKNRWVKVAGARRRSWLPIKELFGPGVPEALANEQVTRALDQFIAEKFEPVFRRNLAYYASR